MKIKKHVTTKAIRSYLNKQKIDEKKLFSMHRLTKEGLTQIHQITHHFTDATIKGNTLHIDLGDKVEFQSADFESPLIDRVQLDNINKLTESINTTIDFRNFAIEKIGRSLAYSETMSKEEEDNHNEIMQKGQSQIDKLNQIGKRRAITLNDLDAEVVEGLLDARIASRAFNQKAQRHAELEKLKNSKDQKNEQER